MNVLILATGKPSRHLIAALEQRKHTFEVHDPRNLYLFVSESERGYDRIYDGRAELETPQRLKAKNYEGIISRIGANLPHGAAILRHLTENLGIYSPQDADGLETASNKLKTTQRLSKGGLSVPITMYGNQVAHVDFAFDMLGGLPAIAKLLQGSQGKGVMILETKLAANTMLESFYKLDAPLKLQRFIQADGKDVRAIVVGNRVAVAMERTSNEGDFRANLSRQGSGRKVQLSDQDEAMCIKAAKAVGLEFAGVDLMKDKEGKSYIVEVNGNPGTKIIDITGHNYFVDLVRHLEDKTHKAGASSQETKAQSSQTPENGFTFRELISNPVNTLQSLFMKEKQGETLTYNEEAVLHWHKHHNEDYWKEKDKIN